MGRSNKLQDTRTGSNWSSFLSRLKITLKGSTASKESVDVGEGMGVARTGWLELEVEEEQLAAKFTRSRATLHIGTGDSTSQHLPECHLAATLSTHLASMPPNRSHAECPNCHT